MVVGQQFAAAEDPDLVAAGGLDHVVKAREGLELVGSRFAQPVGTGVERTHADREPLAAAGIEQARDALVVVEPHRHLVVGRREIELAFALGRPDDGRDHIGATGADLLYGARPVHAAQFDLDARAGRPELPEIAHRSAQLAMNGAQGQRRELVDRHDPDDVGLALRRRSGVGCSAGGLSATEQGSHEQ